MSDEKESLTDHEYDGIREFDNPLPTWWLWTFLITIGFSFIYFLHFFSGSAPTQIEELNTSLSTIKKQAKATNTKEKINSPDTEESMAQLLGQTTVVDLGREIFKARCVSCHGPELQGLIGPNLVDEYWLHGQGRWLDILTIVKAGVLEKGMPPWEAMLQADEIRAVVAFIVSQKGTHPKNPKAPQGEKIGNP